MFIENSMQSAGIQEKRQSINERYERICNLAAHRQARLNEALTLHQFFRDIADEESWIKEKKLSLFIHRNFVDILY
ncbi:Spectrin alpha chain [Lucilia cuprina]|uniref:Spectrin alpha chain n=1 Tax=Lucilia cuprina TaxID=7375 RepID=A0A0L0CSE3_LUCCU|nr:Spectrin alpha chain [Lucilia cuprina]